jgi:hypothetical protein
MFLDAMRCQWCCQWRCQWRCVHDLFTISLNVSSL